MSLEDKMVRGYLDFANFVLNSVKQLILVLPQKLARFVTQLFFQYWSDLKQIELLIKECVFTLVISKDKGKYPGLDWGDNLTVSSNL